MGGPDLESFASSVKNFAKLPSPTQNELLIYFITVVRGQESATAAELDALRASLHLRPYRTAQHLSGSAKRRGRKLPRLIKRVRGYALVRTTRDELSTLISKRPSHIATAADIRSLLNTTPPGRVQDYLIEAIGCFESGFHRAATVMAWCLAYSLVRDWIFNKHVTSMNREMAAWKKPRFLTRVEDLDELTERIILDTARQAGILTKEKHKVLVSLLDRRNSYAHPTGRSISETAAEAYIREVIDEVVSHFK